MQPSIIIIGIVMLAAIAAQISFGVKFTYFMNSEFKLNRRAMMTVMVPHLVVGAIIVLGTVLYHVFIAYEGTRPQPWRTSAFEYVVVSSWGSVAFALILSLKGLFGPIIAGVTISYSVYLFFEKSIVSILPLMDWAISFLIKSADENTAVIYSTLFIISTLAVHGASGFTKFEWEDVSGGVG